MTTDDRSREKPSQAAAFERLAAGRSPNLVREFVDFLRHNKKWWLAPILIALLLLGLIVILGTAAPPFIYPF